MVLLTFAALAIAGAAIKGVTKDIKKSVADNRIENDEYSLDHFEDVLTACFVTRKKQDGMKYLPENGWKDCISYVRRQPYTTEKDVKEFINHYRKVRQRELGKIRNKWKTEYENARREYLSNPASSREFVFEKKFYAFFDEKFVRELASELYDKTFMGDMAVQRPKVVPIEATNEAYVMVWVLKCYGGKPKAKKYFRVSCRYLDKPID